MSSKIPFPFRNLAFGYPTVPLLPSPASKLKNIDFAKTGEAIHELGQIMAHKSVEFSVLFTLVDDSSTVITKNPTPGGFPMYGSTYSVSASASAVLKWKFKFSKQLDGLSLGQSLFPGSANDGEGLVGVSDFSECRTKPIKASFTTTYTTDAPGGNYSGTGVESWLGTSASISFSFARDAKGNFYVAIFLNASVYSPGASSLQGGASVAVCTGKLSRWYKVDPPGPHRKTAKESLTFLKTDLEANYVNFDNPETSYAGPNNQHQTSTGGFRASLSDAALKVS